MKRSSSLLKPQAVVRTGSFVPADGYAAMFLDAPPVTDEDRRSFRAEPTRPTGVVSPERREEIDRRALARLAS